MPCLYPLAAITDVRTHLLFRHLIFWFRIARSCLRGWLLLAFALVALLFLPAAFASTSDPATQQLLLQQEREQALRQQQNKPADVRLSQPAAKKGFTPLPTDESPCFVISQINLTGDDAKKFQFALKSVTSGPDSALGRCLGVKGINAVMARMQNSIIKRGYVTTRVVAAPQDLKSGVLQLLVVPGYIHQIRFAAETPSTKVTLWDALPMGQGDILNLRDIEQGLENLKRVPTAEADIQIEPTQAKDAKPGESDLVVKYKQAFPLRLTLSADNSGSQETGKYQGSATLSYDNPFRLNDLFYATLNHDLGGGTDQYGTNGHTLFYSVPFGYWQLKASNSRYHYDDTVAGINQSYIYSGDSETTEVTLSRLIYRDAVRKTTLSLGGYLTNSHNFIEDTEIEVQRRRVGGWKPSIAHREYIGQATLDLDVTYRMGTRAFGSLPAPESGFGEGTSLSNIWLGNAVFNVPFTVNQQRFRYNLTWRGQWTKDVLIPQDRFSIGNRYTVRGFDGEQSLSAERGWFVRNDLGLTLGKSNQELYVGLDYGQVSGQSAEFLPGQELAGTALGLRGGKYGVVYDVFAAWPLLKPDGFKTAGTTYAFSLSWTI